MLDWRGAQAVANSIQDVLAGGAIVAHDAYLDEFVGGEVAVDFARYRRREAAAADQDGGFERMGAGFEGPAFDWRELQQHVISFKQAF